MPEQNAFQMVERYLQRQISQAELQRWLWDSWAMFEAPAADERDLAGTAMHFGWILEDGEWTEDAFRRELELEYHKALEQRPSPVS